MGSKCMKEALSVYEPRQDPLATYRLASLRGLTQVNPISRVDLTGVEPV